MKTWKLYVGFILTTLLCSILIVQTPANGEEFAQWNAPPEDIMPQVHSYEIKPDLSNVTNFCDNVLVYYIDYDSKTGKEIKEPEYLLSDSEMKKLAANGFCVSKSACPEFFGLYEYNRYNSLANFVTTDSILHNYHLMFEHVLMQLESEKLSPELEKISQVMLQISLEQHEKFIGTEWENAARRNVAFFSVGLKLLKPEIEIPAIVKSEVCSELKLIESAERIELSPIMNMNGNKKTDNAVLKKKVMEDYTQYIPRSHYTRTELLKRYFKSMMWYGRMNFNLSDEDDVRSSILMTYAIKDPQVKDRYEKVFDTVNFFVGQSDDLTYFQYSQLINEIFGNQSSWKTVHENSRWFYEFIEKAKNLPSPQINSMPVTLSDSQTETDKQIKGFRFMGQRFTLDASVFQKLIDPSVPGRYLPAGLDIPAAMGSDEALKILEIQGETSYSEYTSRMTESRKYIKDISLETWTQNLYWGWLYSLVPLTELKGTGYPSMMQSSLWDRKSLNTYLSSWTELKHDTVLYAKQCAAECGGPEEELPERDDRGYVEPDVKVYSRLAGLIDLTISGLDKRNLLDESNRKNLGIMKQLVMYLYNISVKELSNQVLTDEEYELIRSYGAQLEHLWLEINKDEMERLGEDRGMFLDDNPAALVTDVASRNDGVVLEEATGHIFKIYAIVPVAGELKLVSGGVYSHYEFTWPSHDRLTDEAWRSLLPDSKCPPLPEWVLPYMSDNEDVWSWLERY